MDEIGAVLDENWVRVRTACEMGVTEVRIRWAWKRVAIVRACRWWSQRGRTVCEESEEGGGRDYPIGVVSREDPPHRCMCVFMQR